MTAVATPADVREAIGLTSEEADDSKLEGYITKAYRNFLNDVGIKVIDNVLTGDIDGTNTIFFTSYTPIADIDFDGTVSTLDIAVYKWGTTGSLDTRETITLSAFDPTYGRLVTTTAPSDTIDIVTASYYYYPRHIPDELIVDAISYLAGYYYVMQEFLLIPEKLSHGSYRWTHVKPYVPIWEEYLKARMAITARLAEKTEHDDVVQIRKEVT